jgi:hypothetical protein
MNYQNNKDYSLETEGPTEPKPEKKASWYIAVGLLLSIGIFFPLQLCILLSEKKSLFPFFIVTGKGYALGSIPNSEYGGGWTSGPLFIFSLIAGITGGWATFLLQKFIKKYKKGHHL